METSSVSPAPQAEPSQTHGAALASLPERTVFFDGYCGFCDRSVSWIFERDSQGAFHFAPLQGPTADALRAAQTPGFPDTLESLVLVERRGESLEVSVRSAAVFAIAAQLPTAARHWAHLAALPRWLTDAGYGLLARARYQIFGKLETCRLPTPEERARFLP